MSVLELDPNAEVRNRKWQDFVPKFARVIRDEPPAPPPRPAAERVVPQDLASAQASLATLQTAGAAIRAKCLADPDLARAPENYAPGAAKSFLARWADDVARCLRDAAAGPDLTLLQCGDPGRIDRALHGVDRSRLGAIDVQGRVVADLTSAAANSRYADVHAPKLRAADAKVAKCLLALRDAWQARIALAEQARRDGGPVTATTPAIPRLTDQLGAIIRQVRNAKSPEDLL